MKLTCDYGIYLEQEGGVYEMMNQAYLEAIFKLMPCMVGENRWEQLGKESQGDFDKMVTRTDEALLLWAIDCYWNVLATHPDLKELGDNRPTKAPYYISEGNTTRKNKGWTEEGKTKYNEYFKLVKKKCISSSGDFVNRISGRKIGV